MQLILTPELLLEAYRQGLFPMAYNAQSTHIHWLAPDMRGQLSIPHLHIPQSLKKIVLKNARRNEPYRISVDETFKDVLQACAEQTLDRPETWINAPIFNACIGLYEKGYAHSVECWRVIEGREMLVGGLYGIAIGGAFFGESMFSRESNVSKICLVHLAARLWRAGFTLLDAQFVNDHLMQFGIYEVPKAQYKRQLKEALHVKTDFTLSDAAERDLIEAYFAMRRHGAQTD